MSRRQHAVGAEAEARRDSMRDVLGLYRAAISGDAQGMRVILGATDCLTCLAGGAVQVGLWLAATEDGDITEAGAFAPEFAAEVLEMLGLLQYNGEVPGGGDHDEA